MIPNTVQKEQMGDVSSTGKLWEKEQGEMLETTDIVTKMKTAFDGLICRLDVAKERSSELQSWVGHLYHCLPGSENIKEEGEERM